MKISFIPSFKAGFDLNDGNTKKSIRKIVEDNPKALLAMHLAMKDIDSSDTLQLSAKESPLWGMSYKVKNSRTGFSFELWEDNFQLLLRYMSNNCQTYYKSPFRKQAKKASYDYLAKSTMMINDSINKDKLDEYRNLEQLIDKNFENYFKLDREIKSLKKSIEKSTCTDKNRFDLELQLVEKKQAYKNCSDEMVVLNEKYESIETDITNQKADFVESVIYEDKKD